MRKYLYGLFLLIIPFAVNAQEISKNDIESNSYVIGEHVFTSDTLLTMQHIMLASKTIDSNNLEDMIMYYKNPWGEWSNGITGESIDVQDTFDIMYENLEIKHHYEIDEVKIYQEEYPDEKINASKNEDGIFIINSGLRNHNILSVDFSSSLSSESKALIDSDNIEIKKNGRIISYEMFADSGSVNEDNYLFKLSESLTDAFYEIIFKDESDNELLIAKLAVNVDELEINELKIYNDEEFSNEINALKNIYGVFEIDATLENHNVIGLTTISYGKTHEINSLEIKKDGQTLQYEGIGFGSQGNIFFKVIKLDNPLTSGLYTFTYKDSEGNVIEEVRLIVNVDDLEISELEIYNNEEYRNEISAIKNKYGVFEINATLENHNVINITTISPGQNDEIDSFEIKKDGQTLQYEGIGFGSQGNLFFKAIKLDNPLTSGLYTLTYKDSEGNVIEEVKLVVNVEFEVTGVAVSTGINDQVINATNYYEKEYAINELNSEVNMYDLKGLWIYTPEYYSKNYSIRITKYTNPEYVISYSAQHPTSIGSYFELREPLTTGAYIITVYDEDLNEIEVFDLHMNVGEREIVDLVVYDNESYENGHVLGKNIYEVFEMNGIDNMNIIRIHSMGHVYTDPELEITLEISKDGNIISYEPLAAGGDESGGYGWYKLSESLSKGTYNIIYKDQDNNILYETKLIVDLEFELKGISLSDENNTESTDAIKISEDNYEIELLDSIDYRNLKIFHPDYYGISSYYIRIIKNTNPENVISYSSISGGSPGNFADFFLDEPLTDGTYTISFLNPDHEVFKEVNLVVR